MDDGQTFSRWLAQRHYSTTTIEIYLLYARRLGRHADPRSCTLRDLEDFFETLPQTAPSHAMARKALTLFLRSLGRSPNPAEQLPRVPERDRLPRPLSDDEYARWIAAARDLGGIHHLIAVMLATTGVRQGELRKARRDDISLGVPATWRVRGKGARQSGPRWRVVPLHGQAVELLADWPEAGPWLFPGSEDGHMTDRQMRRYVVDIGHRAGIGRVTAHRLRHTSGSMVLDLTGNLRTTQEFLGHRSIASTVLYTRVRPEKLAEVVALLPV